MGDERLGFLDGGAAAYIRRWWAGGPLGWMGRQGKWAAGLMFLREPNKWFSAKNLSIFLKKLKIANKCKNSQKLNMTLHMLCIAYKKVVVVKLKFKFL
jgi:hypothetical protein